MSRTRHPGPPFPLRVNSFVPPTSLSFVYPLSLAPEVVQRFDSVPRNLFGAKGEVTPRYKSLSIRKKSRTSWTE